MRALLRGGASDAEIAAAVTEELETLAQSAPVSAPSVSSDDAALGAIAAPKEAHSSAELLEEARRDAANLPLRLAQVRLAEAVPVTGGLILDLLSVEGATVRPPRRAGQRSSLLQLISKLPRRPKHLAPITQVIRRCSVRKP